MTTNQRYSELVDRIITTGSKVDSRFGETIELLGQSFTFEAGDVLARKGQNIKVGFCELVQLIAGIYDGEAFKKYAPNSDNSLFTRAMAYGPRTVGTIDKILHTLTVDPKNRQSYAFIGRPGEEGSSNLPCTLGLQFIVRDGGVYCNAFMRSLDVLKGLPVDVIMFGGMTQMIASCLSLEPRSITVLAGSAHVYTVDIEADKLPLPYGKVRKFNMPDYAMHKEYVEWAIVESDWDWNDMPQGMTLAVNDASRYNYTEINKEN